MGDHAVAETSGQWQVVHGRNFIQSSWPMDVPDRGIDSLGDEVEFLISGGLPAAKRLLRKAFKRYGRPNRIVIGGKRN